MKALSIRQPWAWAILHGKPVENRTWPTSYTGPIFIHAGKKFDRDGYYWLLGHRDLLTSDLPAIEKFAMGGIVGKANIIDCVDYHPSPFFFGPWGFVLDGAEPIGLIPCPGRLGLFEYAC